MFTQTFKGYWIFSRAANLFIIYKNYSRICTVTLDTFIDGNVLIDIHTNLVRNNASFVCYQKWNFMCTDRGLDVFAKEQIST